MMQTIGLFQPEDEEILRVIEQRKSHGYVKNLEIHTIPVIS